MKRHLNLLPWQERYRTLVRERFRQWCYVWAVLALATSTVGLWEWKRLGTSERETEVWRRMSEPAVRNRASNKELQQKIAVAQERITAYGHLESESIGFSLLGTISQCTGHCQDKLQVRKLKFKTTQKTDVVPVAFASTTPAPPNTKPVVTTRTVHIVSLSGVATSNLTVARFVSALRDSALFQTVDLKSSQGKTELTSHLRHYEVECSF